MKKISMCRICLAANVRLCSVARNLQDMYEKLTEMTFNREDRRPLVACYICHARLRNCYQLRASCLRSDELWTEMLISDVFTPQELTSTNTLSTVAVVHLSLGHEQQNSTDCHVTKHMEVIEDAELKQKYTKDTKNEAGHDLGGQTDGNNQWPYFEVPFEVIKIEPDDVETDTKNEAGHDLRAQTDGNNQWPYFEVPLEIIKREQDDVETDAEDIEENALESDGAGPSSKPADNICRNITKVHLKRMDLNGTRISTSRKKRRQATKKISINRNEQDSEDKNIVIYDEPIVIINDMYKTVDEVHRDNKMTAHDGVHKRNIRLKNKKGGKKQFECDVCKKCFSEHSNFRKHMRTHAVEKRFECDVCGSSFKIMSRLKTHMRTHSGVRPFTCDVCKKSFSDQYILIRHIRTHTGEKPFVCDVCKKCFSRHSNLTAHVRTHTGEKPYMCDVCEKCFNEHRYLKVHMRIHTGEKPYKCDVCKKCFSENGTLRRHMRTHLPAQDRISDQ